MDIQLDREEAMKMLQETDDHSLIMKVKKMLEKKKKDWWDDLTEQQKADITQSELEFERGEVISYEDVMKKYR
ncbi:hypothetical protein EV144_102271 [Flavobacterium sp. 270]|uniref:hypothetical protein n=1 Tax=Flavobacterium sp. 270 TaxID=2512114 RepID=UPI001066BABD|nr:hypothetical protein [Flavobacterium sp. 270]TDW49846.1 hypothetical protein EV144_102271 [Flavobacterium sp. 270]